MAAASLRLLLAFFVPLASAVKIHQRPFNVFVSDTGNHCIQKIDKKGRVTVFAGVCGEAGMANSQGSAARFNQPFGIDTDNAGNLYLADGNNNCIRKITQQGVVSTFSGLCSSDFVSQPLDGPVDQARFTRPQYVTFQAKTKLLFVTEASDCLRTVSQDGHVRTLSAGSCTVNGAQDSVDPTDLTFRLLQGITAGSGGTMFFTDDHCVRKLDRQGVISVFAGTCNKPGFANGQGVDALFNAAIGITLDSKENLYVVDMGNNCIRKVTRGGEVSTLAGKCGEKNNGTMDGVGIFAQFQGPWDLEMGYGGNLIIADSDNSCIRKVSLASGEVTTFAGVCGMRKGLGEFRYPRGITVW